MSIVRKSPVMRSSCSENNYQINTRIDNMFSLIWRMGQVPAGRFGKPREKFVNSLHNLSL